MQLQEEQPSNFIPVHDEFSRFSSGSKPNRFPRCRQSFSTDGANISIIFERCIIVCVFFHFQAIFLQNNIILIVFHCSILSLIPL